MDKQEREFKEFLEWLFKKDDSNTKVPEVCGLLKEYEEKFNEQISTEELIMKDEELAAVLKKCLKENKTFSEVTGIYFDDDDYI